MPTKILSIFGTRPEAIKMAPVVKQLELTPGVESIVCVTGQHRTMLSQVLDLFGVRPHHDLALMTGNQTLNGLASRLIASIDEVLAIEKPDRVLVHGDTTTACAAALAAFHRQIPIGHVEAGLRTGNLAQPWPEEMNRRVIDVMSDLMFAPTESSRINLLAESLGGRIIVTGNTVIDALYLSAARIDTDAALRVQLDQTLAFLDPQQPVVLVTGHRRENFGAGFAEIIAALGDLARSNVAQIVYPVHLNPNVQQPVNAILAGQDNVHLIAPQDYLPFVYLMDRAYLIVTDSGGIQEEAPALGKPVLVTRDTTERPEAVASGTARLVGTDTQRIVAEAETLLQDADEYQRMAQAHNPYGDGQACHRIVDALKAAFDAPAEVVARGPQLVRKPATEAEIINLEAARATAIGAASMQRLNG